MRPSAIVSTLDSTWVPVHKRAAGARENSRQAIGRSRGGLTTKVHLMAASTRHALCFGLSPGDRHDAPMRRELLRTHRPTVDFLVRDCAYEDYRMRELVSNCCYTVVVPKK